MHTFHNRLSFLHITLLCSFVFVLGIASFPTAAHADTNSAVIAMNLRAPDSTEITGMESLVGPTVLPQSGPNINHFFTETPGNLHTGRVWVAEAKPNLQSCDTNVSFSIEGDHKVKHDLISASNPVSGDEAEVGGLVVDGGNRGLLVPDAIAVNADLGPNQSVNITAPTTAVSTELAMSGIKVLMYVETRDDKVQGGVQSSFTYSGTPLLRISYDHSKCTAPQTQSPTTVKASTKKSNSVVTTTVPTAVQGVAIENSAFALGKKTSIASQSKPSYSQLPKKMISIPHAKTSQGNSTVNAITFSTLIVLLITGMCIFIVKQRKMRRPAYLRRGRRA